MRGTRTIPCGHWSYLYHVYPPVDDPMVFPVRDLCKARQNIIYISAE
jgi:hypothetical protein